MASVSSSGSNPAVQAVSESETDHQLTKEVDMSNLYVQNLPFLMNTDKLLNLFLPYGQVTSAKVAMDYTSGVSKGYGFVKFSDPHDAAHAVIELNGRLVEGRKIEVRVSGVSSSPEESHANNRTLKEIDMSNLKGSETLPANESESACSQSGSKLVKEVDMANLYVGRVPSAVTCEQLVQIFYLYGEIVQAKKFDAGYGMIRYANASSAAAAINHLDGYQIGGSTLVVRIAVQGFLQNLMLPHLPEPLRHLAMSIDKLT